jgi:hypothetical protein
MRASPDLCRMTPAQTLARREWLIAVSGINHPRFTAAKDLRARLAAIGLFSAARNYFVLTPDRLASFPEFFFFMLRSRDD